MPQAARGGTVGAEYTAVLHWGDLSAEFCSSDGALGNRMM
jgi:hypothetical protein